jgi:tetratricopeptide (TPR) repeat protein
LAVCSDCRDRASEISVLERLKLLESWLYPNYDEAFNHATTGVAERLVSLQADARNSAGLLAELLRESAAIRRQWVVREERFHSLKLCELLRSRCRESWFSDPATGLELAELAVLVAKHLDSGRYGSNLVEDARALSWAYLGNASRLVSDLWRAEGALHQAWIHRLQDEGDPYSEAELLNLTSSLLNVQNRFDEAIRLTDRAIYLYREVQDRHLEGAMLIQKGLHLGDYGRPHEAIAVIQAGLERLDGQRDPQLLLMGQHNLVCFLSKTGAPGKARELLNKSESLYRDFGEQLHLVRFCWLEGQIAQDLGHLREAARSLQGVRDSFLDHQLGTDVLLVSLDLALVHAAAGQCRQVKEVLGEVIPLGEALGLRQEALRARLLYEQASRG